MMLPDDRIGTNNTSGIRTSNAVSYSRVHGESLVDYVDRAKFIMEKLEGDAAVHIQRGWFTHKLVGGCWICDTLCFGRILLREINYILSQEAMENTNTAMDSQVPVGDDGPDEESNTG